MSSRKSVSVQDPIISLWVIDHIMDTEVKTSSSLTDVCRQVRPNTDSYIYEFMHALQQGLSCADFHLDNFLCYDRHDNKDTVTSLDMMTRIDFLNCKRTQNLRQT